MEPLVESPAGLRSPDDTRQRILTAVRELVALKGSRGTTTREVAERAAVNEATIFRHFGTKQNLLCEMREFAQDPAPLEHAAERPSGDVSADLTHLAKLMVERLQRNADLIRVAIAEEALDPSGSDACWRGPHRAKAILIKVFAHYCARGDLRGDPDMLTRQFMGMFFSLVIAKKIWGIDRPDDESAIAFCLDNFLNGARSRS